MCTVSQEDVESVLPHFVTQRAFFGFNYEQEGHGVKSLELKQLLARPGGKVHSLREAFPTGTCPCNTVACVEDL